MTTLHYTVTDHECGWQVQSVCKTALGLSRKLRTALKKHQSVTINGIAVPLYTPVRTGDIVVVTLPEDERSSPIPMRPMRLDILYEDDTILVLNKAAGTIVHPTHGHYDDTLASGILHHWMQRGETHLYRPIHRLDHYTTGVLLIAKSRYMHAHIAKQFMTGTIKKTYLALVHGALPLPHGTIDIPIQRRDHHHERTIAQNGPRCRTDFVRLCHNDTVSLVQLHPQTGKTHQLRVHMKCIGHPLIGDTVYAPQEPVFMGRQALHAHQITYTDPYGQPITYRAPLPEDMRACIRALGGQRMCDAVSENKMPHM